MRVAEVPQLGGEHLFEGGPQIRIGLVAEEPPCRDERHVDVREVGVGIAVLVHGADVHRPRHHEVREVALADELVVVVVAQGRVAGDVIEGAHHPERRQRVPAVLVGRAGRQDDGRLAADRHHPRVEVEVLGRALVPVADDEVGRLERVDLHRLHERLGELAGVSLQALLDLVVDRRVLRDRVPEGAEREHVADELVLAVVVVVDPARVAAGAVRAPAVGAVAGVRAGAGRRLDRRHLARLVGAADAARDRTRHPGDGGGDVEGGDRLEQVCARRLVLERHVAERLAGCGRAAEHAEVAVLVEHRHHRERRAPGVLLEVVDVALGEEPAHQVAILRHRDERVERQPPGCAEGVELTVVGARLLLQRRVEPVLAGPRDELRPVRNRPPIPAAASTTTAVGPVRAVVVTAAARVAAGAPEDEDAGQHQRPTLQEESVPHLRAALYTPPARREPHSHPRGTQGECSRAYRWKSRSNVSAETWPRAFRPGTTTRSRRSP